MHRSVTGAWEGVAFLGLEIELAPRGTAMDWGPLVPFGWLAPLG